QWPRTANEGLYRAAESPGPGTPAVLPGRRERAARKHDLHAAIAGTTVDRAVVGHRLGGAETRHVYHVRRDALCNQKVADGHRASQGQIVIGRIAARYVRVALDGDLQVRIGRDYPGEPREV